VSDEVDRENRTEPASPQRLQRAREEGQVPVGHDAILVAGLAASSLTLFAVAGTLRAGVADLLREAAATLDRVPFSTLPSLALRPVAAVAAVCMAAGVGATAAALAQTGGGFWGNLAAPDPSRLFQPQRLGRLLTKDFLVDLLLAVAKVAAIGWAAWGALRDEVAGLPSLLHASPRDQVTAAFRMLAGAARPVLGAAFGLAAVELLLSRRRFAVRMRMTKEEAKREQREEDGDPLLRGRRKRRHRDLVRNRARAEVPRADALVVNPTHVAVAVRYRREEASAPRVTAKGKGAMAEFMRDLAREHAVPIVEDVPLARLLYRKVKVGREIPTQTYQAVAAVLAFVYRVTGRGRART